MKKDILILGGSGYFGGALNNYLGKEEVLSTYYNNKIENGVFFDLKETSLIDIRKHYPTINKVIIAAGINNFKLINEDPDKAYYYNVECTKRIIDEMFQLGILPIFLSSESVFDGIKGNYIESDSTRPTFVYAEHKDTIEKYIMNKFEKYLIFRIAKIFDSNLYGNTLIANWINDFVNNKDIFCADDNIFCPIHLNDLLIMTKILIIQNSFGLFHLCSREPLNRKEMLDLALNDYSKHYNYKGNIKYKSLNNFSGAENQPLNTSMNPNKAINRTKYYPKIFPYWVKRIIKNLRSNGNI